VAALKEWGLKKKGRGKRTRANSSPRVGSMLAIGNTSFSLKHSLLGGLSLEKKNNEEKKGR